MATITEVSFKHKNESYKFKIDFDDVAIMEDKIAFDLEAKKSKGKSPEISVSARVEIDPKEGRFHAYIGDEQVFSGSVFNEESELEKAINSIPSELLGDPITGCAIRAGVSSIIGQAITCARSIEESRFLGSVSEYLKCMVGNFTNISTTAMWRAFKCIAKYAP